MDYDIAMKALEKAEPYIEPEEFEALTGIVALFRPYDLCVCA